MIPSVLLLLRKMYLLPPLSTSFLTRLLFAILFLFSRKDKKVLLQPVSFLWYLSAHILKAFLSCAQIVRATPPFPCDNPTPEGFSLATQKPFCWCALFCLSSF